MLIGGGLDEVAWRKRADQSWVVLIDLPADDKRSAERTGTAPRIGLRVRRKHDSVVQKAPYTLRHGRQIPSAKTPFNSGSVSFEPTLVPGRHRPRCIDSESAAVKL